MNLVDLLIPEAGLEWVVARVRRIHSSPVLVDAILGEVGDDPSTTAEVRGAAVLGSYTPVVGDVVHILVHPAIGALVLGKAHG